MLRIAENWLRQELIEKEKAGVKSTEDASGPQAIVEKDPMQNPFNSGGGFSAGRMGAYGFDGC